ncbi:MAG: O-antigen ligase family protein [Parcubacteria group bacterium]|nr:O-antigen ligase family protein [Parcubacteria group bacterium]
MKQFFGRAFRDSLILAAVLYGLALLAYQTNFSGVLIVAMILASALVAFKRLDRALYLVFLELFINPHGVLITSTIGSFSLSLRMAIFLGIMVGWGIGLATHRYKVSRKELIEQPHFGMLVLAAAIGLIIGTLSRDPSLVFADGNAYLFVLYLLPILSVDWTSRRKHELLQVLAAGVVWVSSISIILLFIFSHMDGMILRPIYTMFRDLRIAEITALDSGLYRVFMQSQFYVLVFGLIVLSMVGSEARLRWLLGLSTLTFAVVLLSLSRSFWVGLIPAVIFVLWILWQKHRPKKIQIVKYLGWIVFVKVTAMIGLVAIVLFPFPSQDLSGADLIGSLRDRTSDNDVAITSRWNLLWPMLDKIVESPLVGHGFGATVTFTTDDPRARAINPDGKWTTSSMEWGWLELWIKMGVLGPIAFLAIGWHIASRLWSYRWTDQSWLGTGLIAGLIFLFAAHFFSPYLNHPIGIGYLLFLVPFLSHKKTATVQVEEFVAAPIEVVRSKAMASRQ